MVDLRALQREIDRLRHQRGKAGYKGEVEESCKKRLENIRVYVSDELARVNRELSNCPIRKIKELKSRKEDLINFMWDNW